MRVRCIRNRIDDVAEMPELHRYLTRTVHLDGTLPIEIGRRSTVYAIERRVGVDWYYVLVDDGDDYPKAYPAPFFDVEDAAVPSDFVTVGALASFHEWAEHPDFYERLVDGELRAVTAFGRMRATLEDAADVTALGHAVVLDAGWLQCPRCDHAWDEPSTAGVVRCPSCGAVLTVSGR